MRIHKELKQRILNDEYKDILTKADIKNFKLTGEVPKEKLDKITFKDLIVYQQASQSPANHFVVDLGIKEFKRRMRNDAPVFIRTKSQKNKAIALYKKKAWTEYAATIGFKGSHPTVPVY